MLSIEMLPFVHGLPNGSYVEYFGRLREKDRHRFFIVFRPEVDWDYTKFRFFVSRGDKLEELTEYPITQVVRYRDGGTTIIKTLAGEFVFPTCFEPERKPTYCGDEIEVMGHLRGPIADTESSGALL